MILLGHLSDEGFVNQKVDCSDNDRKVQPMDDLCILALSCVLSQPSEQRCRYKSLNTVLKINDLLTFRSVIANFDTQNYYVILYFLSVLCFAPRKIDEPQMRSFIAVFASTTRSQAYIQSLVRSKMLPSYVVILDERSDLLKIRPEHREIKKLANTEYNFGQASP